LSKIDVKKNYQDEVLDSILYAELSKRAKDPEIEKVLSRMSKMEERHASIWREIAKIRGIEVKGPSPLSMAKVKIMAMLSKVLGVNTMIKLREGNEDNDVKKYVKLSASDDLSPEEKVMMNDISVDEAAHEEILSQVTSNVSEFIYGISDGLVEVLAAVSGLSGAVKVPLYVAVGGLVIGVSGMMSMGIGSFLSSESEEEMSKKEREKISLQKKVDPESVRKRVQEFLSSIGVNETDSFSLSGKLVGGAEDLLAPKGEKSPIKGALVTAASYITGAIIPSIPYILGIGGLEGVLSSFLVSGIAIAVVGYMIGIVSSVNPRRKSIEMSVLGLGAAVATYLLGNLLSSLLGIQLA
jgi:VIT1/CCC1 family predicted Fe2+/Mn2+ transporter